MKNNIFSYVASKNRRGTLKLLKNAGYRFCPKNKKQASLMLADMVKKDQDKGLAQIANIHPDRDLILKYAAKKDKQVSADAFNSNLNASGDGSRMPDKTLNLLILTGTGILAISMITLIATSK